MYVTEIKEKQIFQRIRWATPHFWERFLQIADPCLFLWKLPRCEPKCPQQRSDIQPQALRICKKRTQKVLMFATLILSNICFSFISVTYTWSLFKPLHSVYVIRYWLIIFVFVNRRWKILNKTDNTQHTHPLKFSNLVIVHTLDFRYMIKNK